MTTVYVDTHLTDDERRRRLYAGDIFVFSPRPSTQALTEFARELIEEAFGGLDPQHAQDSLDEEAETIGESIAQLASAAGAIRVTLAEGLRTLADVARLDPALAAALNDSSTCGELREEVTA